jgi:hypothetical protein
VHEPEGIDNVKHYAPRGAGVFGGNQLVIVGIGVGDATATGRYAFKPVLVERLKKDQECTWSRHLLHFALTD